MQSRVADGLQRSPHTQHFKPQMRSSVGTDDVYDVQSIRVFFLFFLPVIEKPSMYYSNITVLFHSNGMSPLLHSNHAYGTLYTVKLNFTGIIKRARVTVRS